MVAAFSSFQQETFSLESGIGNLIVDFVKWFKNTEVGSRLVY